MILIIEGPDGSGKTTLANQLKNQTGYTLLHRTQPKSAEDKARMMDEYTQMLKAGKNCIMDRSWYSELVYGPVMRDKSVLTFPQMYELERLASKNGALIIYCTAPENILWKCCQRRGEDYITDRDTFHEICVGFDQLMHSVPHLIPVTTYVYEDM